MPHRHSPHKKPGLKLKSIPFPIKKKKKKVVLAKKKRHVLPPGLTSRVFHDNCCHYKVQDRCLRLDQRTRGIQCPSGWFPAPGVPLAGEVRHPNVAPLPEAVVIDMRNLMVAGKMVKTFKKTLVKVHVPDTRIKADDEELLRKMQRRTLRVERIGRELAQNSESDSDNELI
ncbi:uncharacterized protein Dana_GF28181 [Drosophila ananassae]|uniref:Uncharacterized protein n=1 Tax=Drosophila ananassae TaxID=7217 RepID=A0A0P8XS61_DROAN|nr:uncharacterized protein LOC26515590 [Drosophila ananassae]KPU77417.1 uncharacterized protein Dana_GF28181 [Drosophila ananassae]